ncbi:MAG: Gx transporter family protein [Eubacterium sp.]|jgi:heptaprenyl diphosphate synthase|nr:Gx transporter family protein [Eubacterium sp.]
MKKTKKIAVFALCIALAFTLSFLETLIPINIGVPGVKIGLANMVVLAALYLLDKRAAFAISMIRILISGLLFSGAFSLLYSFAGGILSFFVMLLAMKSKKLSILGVSVLGGAVHNIGQIIVAAIVLQTPRIVYYLPVLLISGALAGIVVGIVSKIVVERLIKIDKF